MLSSVFEHPVTQYTTWRLQKAARLEGTRADRIIDSPALRWAILYQKTLMKKIAILIDGGFLWHQFRKKQTEQDAIEAKRILNDIINYHVFVFRKECKDKSAMLYRSFYYDSPPAEITFYNPILKRGQNYKKSETYVFKSALLPLLAKQRKMAIRLGRLKFNSGEVILSASAAKQLAKDPNTKLTDLKPTDAKASLIQKQVDMKIGLDLASIAYKKLADQVVLISADSDFVPVLKVLRREGIDVILDSMGANISPELSEHIDGVRNSKKNVLERAKNS